MRMCFCNFSMCCWGCSTKSEQQSVKNLRKEKLKKGKEQFDKLEKNKFGIWRNKTKKEIHINQY